MTDQCIANTIPGKRCKRKVSFEIGCHKVCWEHAKMFMDLGWPGAYYVPQTDLPSNNVPIYKWMGNKWQSISKRCNDPNIFKYGTHWDSLKHGVYQEHYDTAWNSNRDYMLKTGKKYLKTKTNQRWASEDSDNQILLISALSEMQTEFIPVPHKLFNKLISNFQVISDLHKDSDKTFRFPLFLPALHLYLILDYYSNKEMEYLTLNDYITLSKTLDILMCKDLELKKFIEDQVKLFGKKIDLKFTNGIITTTPNDILIQISKELQHVIHNTIAFEEEIEEGEIPEIPKILLPFSIEMYNLILKISQQKFANVRDNVIVSELTKAWDFLKLNNELLMQFLAFKVLQNDRSIARQLQNNSNCGTIKIALMSLVSPDDKRRIHNILTHKYLNSLDSVEYMENHRYNLQGQTLGEGTFGRVFKSYDSLKKKYVAIKEIKNVANQSKSFLINEINLLIGLCGHPYLVKLTDVKKRKARICVKCSKESLDSHRCLKCQSSKYFRNVTKLYLIFDYRETDYSKYIKNRRMKPTTIKNHIYQILSGLQWMHYNKIVHRDLKPANILYDRAKDRLEITDFGASRKITGRHPTKHLYVTVGYRAPELFFGIPNISKTQHNYKVDSWSIGVILLELLTGISPFYPSKKQIDLYFKRNPRNKRKNKEQVYADISFGLINKLLIKNNPLISLFKFLEKYSHIKGIQKDSNLLYLLAGLLQIDPAKRLSVDQALQSKWFEGIKKSRPNLDYDDCYSSVCIAEAEKTKSIPRDPRRRRI